MDLVHNTGGQNVREHGTIESPRVKLFPRVSFLKNYFEHDTYSLKQTTQDQKALHQRGGIKLKHVS